MFSRTQDERHKTVYSQTTDLFSFFFKHMSCDLDKMQLSETNYTNFFVSRILDTR